MISRKIFVADGSNIRFLSDFIIQSEQFTRVYNYMYDPNGVEGAIDVPSGLYIRTEDVPDSADLITIDKWDLVDNSISFYVAPYTGSHIYIEVATTAEEFGDTLIQPSVVQAELAASNAKASEDAAAASELAAAASTSASAISAAASAASATASDGSATASASSAAASDVSKVAAQLAETNAETAETNAETAQTAAEAAQAAAEAASSGSSASETAAAASAAAALASETASALSASNSNTSALASAASAAEAATSAATLTTASQAEVDAGTDPNKIVTPLTFENANKWGKTVTLITTPYTAVVNDVIKVDPTTQGVDVTINLPSTPADMSTIKIVSQDYVNTNVVTVGRLDATASIIGLVEDGTIDCSCIITLTYDTVNNNWIRS